MTFELTSYGISVFPSPTPHTIYIIPWPTVGIVFLLLCLIAGAIAKVTRP